MRQKRGQSAASAAILVTIISALLILYILFLPPEDRAKLLGTDNGQSGTYPDGQDSAYYQVMLQENIGRLDSLKTSEIKHSIPSFTISTTTQAMEIKKIDSVYVKRSLFEEVSKNISFDVDPYLQNNLLLSFNVLKADGRLNIYLNNNLILDTQLLMGTPKPLELGRDYIQQHNTLVIKTNSPGANFWRINEYQLSDLLISGDVTDISKSTSEQHFSVSETEFSNIEKMELYYYPRCDVRTAAPLFIQLNYHTLFSGVADCGVLNKLEISKNLVVQDDNTMLFSAESGTYLIDRVEVRTTLKTPELPVYYFSASPELQQVIARRQAQIVLSLMFVDDETMKRGTVTVNGYTSAFNTEEMNYAVDISKYVRAGSNSVIIKPQTAGLNVAELKVVVR